MASRAEGEAVRCPLQCGQCCDLWNDVPELLEKAGFWTAKSTGERSHRTSGPCPWQGARGCKMPRAKRPSACTGYLCGVARAVIAKQITHNEGVKLKEHCCEAVPVAAIRRRLS
jgi:hypothetical protein